MRDCSYIFPTLPSEYRGTTLSYWYLIGLTILTTGRSLVHMFAPDGGAGSIAGLDTSGEGGENLISMFAQWGLEQLLLSFVAWVVIIKYRFLVPFVLLVQFLDWSGRALLGLIKPLVVENPPPGKIGNYIFVPLTAIALWFSLPKISDTKSD